jgi:hypothetical protein
MYRIFGASTSTYERCAYVCGLLTVTEARQSIVNETGFTELHKYSQCPFSRSLAHVSWPHLAKAEAAGSYISSVHHSSLHKAQTFENEY